VLNVLPLLHAQPGHPLLHRPETDLGAAGGFLEGKGHRSISSNSIPSSIAAHSSRECTTRCTAFVLQAWMRHNNGLDITEAHEDACQRAGIRPTSSRLEIRLGGMYPNKPAWSTGDGGRPMLENRDVSGMVEKRALSVGTAASGGYTVDSLFMNELEQTLLAFDGPRQVSRVLRTATGGQMLWPTVNDTSNSGALLAEAGSIGSSTDPTFAQKALDAYKYSSKPILVSEELLEDSAFNLSQIIANMLGERLGRILGAQHTTGTGSSQPNGIVTASTAGKTAASATAVTALEILDLIHSVDPAYRSGGSCGFMMNDGILLAIRKLVDGQSRPLWEPSLQMSYPDRLYGYPVSINQNMQATLATGTKTILFGDFMKFVIRDSGSMRFYRLEELYRANDQVGFIAFMRSDSECIQTAAIKHLVQA
jgi:HK97 family phage major capsid protein